MTAEHPNTDNAFSLADSLRRPRTWVSFGLAVMMLYFIFKSLDISVAETIADLFRYRRTVGINIALEGLREALRQRKATPADISRAGVNGKIWKIMEPYVSALISHA